MQAVEFRKFGDPDVVELVTKEKPKPGPNDVLIKVVCAGINVSPMLIFDDLANSLPFSN